MAHVGRDFWKKVPEARDTDTSIWTSLRTASHPLASGRA